MNDHPSRAGLALSEMIGCIVGLGLFATLSTMAFGGVRQRHQIEAVSAHLEEAQNLLARWRAGEPVAEPGWTVAVQPAAGGGEILVLSRPGVRLATVRPGPGGGR